MLVFKYMESIGKEHVAPFEKEEEKIIERIDAQEKLEKIIQFSDDTSAEKRPQDIIMAAKDYLEKLGGVDEEKTKELVELIERAEKEIHKKRLSEVGPITKVDTSRKRSFRKHF